jgi:hypothetical protein
MKVVVYVNAWKTVGDIDRIKLFPTADAAKIWLDEHDPKGEATEYGRARTGRPILELLTPVAPTQFLQAREHSTARLRGL